MVDINLIKNLNVDGEIDLSFLNPSNWFSSRLTELTVGILFVDDQDMPVVDNLKKAGYKVKKIRDIKNVDEDSDLRFSQIVFIDFDGVGRIVSPQHQGAGLVKEIKTKYGKKKYIVLYTAQPTLPADTTMKSLFDAADARLMKDSDVTDFREQIRLGVKSIR